MSDLPANNPAPDHIFDKPFQEFLAYEGTGPAKQPIVTLRNDATGGSHLTNVISRYFLLGEHTGGAYSLSEVVFQAGSQGTPLHMHTREEELYYVIEGKLHVQLGNEQLSLLAGGSVLLPRDPIRLPLMLI